MKMDRFPYAEYLDDDEVNYELSLRGKLNQETSNLSLDAKQRILRTLFKDDAKEFRNYRSSEKVTECFGLILGKITDISGKLGRNRADTKQVSRLLHCWYRSKRCLAENDDQKQMRRELVRQSEQCISANRIVLPATPFKDRINDILTSDSVPEPGSRSVLQQDPVPETPRVDVAVNENATEQAIASMASQIASLQTMMTGVMSLLANQNGGQSNVGDQNLRTPTGNSGNPLPRPALPNRQPGQSRDTGCDDDERQSDSSYGRLYRSHGRNDLHRVEKWRIRFTGDHRALSVEDFLYKIKKIAEREEVSTRQLLRDIHLLLEGTALDWFFTFVEEFEDWESFEWHIRYRFGNPNQDQGIRQKIHERKQQKGEAFIAFVTEIEKLNLIFNR